MDGTSNSELVNAAQGVLNPHTLGGRLTANVASVLIKATGNCFSGVCIDTGSGTGSANLDIEVILGSGRSALLGELLPAQHLPEPVPLSQERAPSVGCNLRPRRAPLGRPVRRRR